MKTGGRKLKKKSVSKHDKALVAVYIILSVIVLLSLVRAIMLGNYENAFLCVLVLLMFAIPSFIKKQFKLNVPNTLEIIVIIFIFASEILGEIGSFFVSVPYWDTILHTTTGFIFAAVGFSLIDVLNRDSSKKFSLSPFYVVLFAFCFSMTIGVIWEFFEFGVDTLLSKDMQKDTVITQFFSTLLDPTKSNIPIPVKDITDVAVNGASLGVTGYLDIGLFDTMEDLFVNFIGALVFCMIGYIYLKHRGKGFGTYFIPTLKKSADNSVESTDEEESVNKDIEGIQDIIK